MTYQPTRSPSDVNESDVNDSPYSPSEITVSQGDLDWRIQRSQPTSTMTPTQVLLQHHRQLQAKPGEKKKSKLGYSRTPVACGKFFCRLAHHVLFTFLHLYLRLVLGPVLKCTTTGPCRQRKIRCIPSTSDPQSSCENCRRLNKECTFIPTESQQGRDQSSSENTSQTAESTSSNASPPDLGAEPYLHSSQQGYHPATHPTSSIWPQSSLSPAVISADRDDIYGTQT